ASSAKHPLVSEAFTPAARAETGPPSWEDGGPGDIPVVAPLRSEAVAKLDAEDVLVPDLSGEGPAVTDVEVGLADDARLGGPTEADPHADLRVDDRVAAGAERVARLGRFLAAENGPADNLTHRGDAEVGAVVHQVAQGRPVAEDVAGEVVVAGDGDE